ncbi:hypothetical protein AVEN_38400-1 [Araneus ventricosus]|uniref:Uncharacterized protein n=1 Tax=Araneus ventricosus TaxID=182803 RepID=A0A4Y2HC50_ARAVE|nr:hypothetical protein AVEN_38400-1 [Araneus ventricosus]
MRKKLNVSLKRKIHMSCRVDFQIRGVGSKDTIPHISSLAYASGEIQSFFLRIMHLQIGLKGEFEKPDDDQEVSSRYSTCHYPSLYI